MLIERKALAVEPASHRRPAHCLDCPDCQGLCLEAAALRLIPEAVLHHQSQHHQHHRPREVPA